MTHLHFTHSKHRTQQKIILKFLSLLISILTFIGSIALTVFAVQNIDEPHNLGNGSEGVTLLPGEKISAEGITANLLSNGSFEQLNSLGQPAGWNIYYNRGSFENGTIAIAESTPQEGAKYIALHSGNGVGPHQASVVE